MARAYAKINLGLRIIGRREDGYHDIETVFHQIDIHDGVSFAPSRIITVESSDPALPDDESNICYRAAMAMKQHLGVNDGVKISIEKHIPVGAGLGGGSTDCAAVLKELPAFWGRSISNNDLAAIALNLGSDVPYFLQRGSAYATGRGEVLDHFETDFPFAILVSFPNIHVSTAWAYQQVKPRGTSQTTLKDELLDAMRAPEKLGAALRNDFEPVVFNAHPEIGAAKDSMLSSGALAAALSGSGSAVFGLYESSAKAEEAGKQFERSGHRVFITREGFRVAN